ncbi:hypothetical protein [Polynucleobacter sp. CS-Odin-A6]|uniref:hypothetical protein n=1 Tax=Polynucleobacter sp. CS-Odin-A6 TaxID=2689106 RepID=UPI001C0D7717|nr:hypothetical protein [Polynucleobacter sp. CS-Odin-A6]MBU3621042.1 hypothetical protein [Polynucleobacter sp. CS-Odin-A6]
MEKIIRIQTLNQKQHQTKPQAVLKLLIACGLGVPMLVYSQTFSPYTPAQMQKFNRQPISPAETPMGPLYSSPTPVQQAPKRPFDSHYIKNPDGEEQAEAQGAESAAPFEPIPATITF